MYIRELEKDECKAKVQRCLSANGLSFSELFDDISVVLNFRRLCVVVDSLISAEKVCDFQLLLTGRTQVCGRVVEPLHQNVLCQP